MKKVKDKCQDCKGKGSVKVENKITDFEPCLSCNGLGYVMRDIVAEDLSFHEQLRIVKSHAEVAFRNMNLLSEDMEKWQGLKKSEGGEG